MLILKNGEYVFDNEEQSTDEIVIPYEEKVVSLIREKYSVDDELAIQRQRDSKPEEFKEYFDYCEECKQKAKEEAE